MSASEWGSYGELTGRSNGYRKGAGLYAFAPLCQGSDALLFGQAMAGRYWDVWSGSLGLGLRRYGGIGWVWGVNGFVDLAYSDQHRLYSQLGLGLEFIGPCLQLRANAYVPFERQHVVGEHCTAWAAVEGTQLVGAYDRRCSTEHTYRGFDIEATGCMDVLCGSVLATAGYFYYSTPGLEDVTGPRVRLEYRIDNLFGWIGSTLFVGGEYEYNRVNHNYGSAYAGVRFPIGCIGRANWCCSPCSPRRQMGERVRRAEAIFVRKRDVVEPNLQNPVGVSLIYLAPVEGEGADGTIDHPFGLAKGVESAEAGSILVLTGKHDGEIALKEGQTLVGMADGLMTPWGPLRAPLADERPQVGSVQLSDGSRVLGIQAHDVRSDVSEVTLSDIVSDRLVVHGNDHWVRESRFDEVEASGHNLHFVDNELGDVLLTGSGLVDLRDNRAKDLSVDGSMQLRAWNNQFGKVSLVPEGDFKLDMRGNSSEGIVVLQKSGHLDGQIRGCSSSGMKLDLGGSSLLHLVSNEVKDAVGAAIDVRVSGSSQLTMEKNRDLAEGEESAFPVTVYQVASVGEGIQLTVGDNGSTRPGVKMLCLQMDGKNDELYAPGAVAQGHPDLRLSFGGKCKALKDPTPKPEIE